MKKLALPALTVFAGALFVSAGANADFTGLLAEVKDVDQADPDFPGSGQDPVPVFVCNLYACYDDPADKQLSVGFSTIDVANGTFFQHSFGSATPPSQGQIGGIPDLAHDTFVTIGRKFIADNGDDTIGVDPDYSAGPSHIEGGWFNSNPDNNYGTPGANDAPDGYVLIAQLTLDLSSGATGVGGVLTSFWKDGQTGETIGSEVEFFHAVPAPGALALLGIAGLLGARRRR